MNKRIFLMVDVIRTKAYCFSSTFSGLNCKFDYKNLESENW
jgi:hypothetical protein